MQDAGTRARISLLGEFVVVGVGGPGGPSGIGGRGGPGGGQAPRLARKNRAVLAALVLAGPAGLPRERLSDMFWQDRGTRQARKSLRQAILDLRKGLGELGGLVQADAERVRFDGRDAEVDVEAFEALAAARGGDRIDRAMALYRGDLLSGLEIKESEFESWLLPRRQRLRFLAVELFGNYLAGAEDVPRVAAVAERLLAIDPYSETAHRALMRMYAAQGQSSAALRQFEECRELLGRGLGTVPSAETVALHDRIRRARRAAPPRSADTGSDTGPGAAPAAPAAGQDASPPPAPAAAPGIPGIPDIPDGVAPGIAPGAAPGATQDRPSIAVLPFENLSPDEADPYFADGITEEITTALSYVQWLFVIARSSAFALRGPDEEAGETLDVRYLLRGSVRRAGGSVRVNARLVDVARNAHVWAGRFESRMEDVFELQDQLATEVVGAIQPGLREAEIAHARRKAPDSLTAYDLYLRALPHVYRMSESDTTLALAMLERAIDIDATFNRARSVCAWVYTLRQSQGWSRRGTGEAAKALEHARICLAREMESDAEILWQSGYALGYFDGNYEDSLAFIDRSLTLNRNSAQAWIIRGMINGYIGRGERAIEDCRTAIRLSPLDPLVCRAHYGLALASIVLEDYGSAVSWARQGVASGPNYIPGYYMLIAGLAKTGDGAECARVGEIVRKQLPGMTVSRWWANTPIRHEPAKRVIADGLRRAGLPA